MDKLKFHLTLGGILAEERRKRTWYIEHQKKKRRAKLKRWTVISLPVILVLAIALAVSGYLTAQNREPAKADATSTQQNREVANPSPSPTSKPAPNTLSVKRPSDRALGVVFAGDSLTYGLFASKESKGYRPQVVASLEKGGPVKWSRGGQTGNKVSTVAESIKFPKSTDLAVLALGTNDIWKTPVGDFATDYKALIAKVKNQAPDAAILCMGAWTDVDGSRNYDHLIEDACEAGGGRYVPITDLNNNPKNHGPAGVESFGGISDVFHPNDSGYKAIADRVLENITVK